MLEWGHRRFTVLYEDAVCAYPHTRPSLLQQAHCQPQEVSWLQTRGHWAAAKWKCSVQSVGGQLATRAMGQVSSSKGQKKTNPSHAQPKGAHLGMLGVLHKDQGRALCVLLWQWLCRARRQPSTSPAGIEEMDLGLREDREPLLSSPPCCVAGPVHLRLGPPAGLSSVPSWAKNVLLPPHLSKMLETLDCTANSAMPRFSDDSWWTHLSLIERVLFLCFTYLIG